MWHHSAADSCGGDDAQGWSCPDALWQIVCTSDWFTLLSEQCFVWSYSAGKHGRLVWRLNYEWQQVWRHHNLDKYAHTIHECFWTGQTCYESNIFTARYVTIVTKTTIFPHESYTFLASIICSRCARNVQSPPLDRGVNYTFSSLSANQHNYITHTDKVVKYIAPSGW